MEILALLVLGVLTAVSNGHSNSTQIPKDKMNIKYNLEAWDNEPGMIIPCTVSYASIATNVYQVIWKTEYGEASWRENGLTRECSMTIGQNPGVGDHTNLWIFTNVSLLDTVIIFTAMDGDQSYNITRNLSHNFGSFGSLGVWELEGPLGSKLWYSNTTGILLNGTFVWAASGGGWLKWDITDTNVLPKIPAGIPGYNIVFLLSIFSIGIIFIVKKLKITNKKVHV